MKIVMLVPSLENKGPIIVAKNIADNSYDKEFEYIFISLKKNKIECLNNFSKFQVYELNMKKNILCTILKLKKVLHEINPNIIHCHCFYPTILAGLYSKKYKIVSTLHNNPKKDYLYQYGKVISFIMIKLMLFFQKKFECNIAISLYIKQIYQEMGLKNIKVIYNGVPFFGKDINVLKNKRILKLITVSELIKIKNVYFLLDVAEKLKEKNILFNFKIIGDGKERINIEKIVKQKNLINEIELVGKVPKEMVFEYLRKADIFLFSSYCEGFGLAVVEALSCKIPVIVSDIPVMKEIVINYKNGIISKVDVEEYIKAILKINTNLDFYKKNTQKYFNKNFYVKEMNKNYIKIYRKMRGD